MQGIKRKERMIMKIEDAFKLRSQICQGGLTAQHKNVLMNIFSGGYDRYFDKKIELAKDDVRFTEEYCGVKNKTKEEDL